jgi:hypothetical protein
VCIVGGAGILGRCALLAGANAFYRPASEILRHLRNGEEPRIPLRKKTGDTAKA